MSQAHLCKIKDYEDKFLQIKQQSGTHSPGMGTLRKTFAEIDIKVDACFLSNPYATDLVIEYLEHAFYEFDLLRDIIEHYPSQQRALRSPLAKRLHVNEENLLIGNGATEIIQALLKEHPKGKMVVPVPTFSSYYEFANPETEVVFYPLKKENDYTFDCDDFLDFIEKENPTTVVLINPNNPNGAYLDLKTMHYLLGKMQHVEQIIIDESFIHFAYEDETLTLVDSVALFKAFENVVLVKSLSKDFGIAGVRIGYALMDATRVDKLLQRGFLWNLNGLAEYLLELMGDDRFFERYECARKTYVKECRSFFEALQKLPKIHVYPTRSNFALVELPLGMSASFFVAALLCEHGVYVRTAGDKVGVGGECVRISVRRHEENQLVLKALEDILELCEEVS